MREKPDVVNQAITNFVLGYSASNEANGVIGRGGQIGKNREISRLKLLTFPFDSAKLTVWMAASPPISLRVPV
jgi:hypothetical protein